MSNMDVISDKSSFVIYCDESCHELTPHHRFMSIGGLKVPRDKKPELTRQLRQLMKSCKLNSELKWSKVSNKRLGAYKKIVGFFFEHKEMHFRAIVVEQARVELEKYHGKDTELAFYKFYYEMLEKWLQPGNEYLILLDYKSNRGANRYKTLKDYLNNYLRGISIIKDLTVVNSKETPLVQLCDVLTGSIAATYNDIKPDTPKNNLASYIASRAKLPTLRTSTPLTAEKFNIFRWSGGNR